MSDTNIALSIISAGALFWIVIAHVQNSFYRAYFFQKQRNRGEDPYAVLREQFPFIWRLM